MNRVSSLTRRYCFDFLGSFQVQNSSQLELVNSLKHLYILWELHCHTVAMIGDWIMTSWRCRQFEQVQGCSWMQVLNRNNRRRPRLSCNTVVEIKTQTHGSNSACCSEYLTFLFCREMTISKFWNSLVSWSKEPLKKCWAFLSFPFLNNSILLQIYYSRFNGCCQAALAVSSFRDVRYLPPIQFP